ncbi:hypothetical protein LIER_30720 [Lithospermum erythrorhizon]|uniref:Uncharacterized protein n=1 Tax=Lithospermum erythrorhizon TaxID=34254 RepID=A0AAV3RUF9_LITER
MSMMAPRLLGEKGASPASFVLVPRLVYPATLVERASTCHCKASIPSGGGVGATACLITTSWRLFCPMIGSFPLRIGGVWVPSTQRQAAEVSRQGPHLVNPNKRKTKAVPPSTYQRKTKAIPEAPNKRRVQGHDDEFYNLGGTSSLPNKGDRRNSQAHAAPE